MEKGNNSLEIGGVEAREYRDSGLMVLRDGRVWSSHSGVYKSVMDNGRGYKAVNVNLGDRGSRKRVRVYVHRMVAECYLGVGGDGMQVNHKDGDKGNNCVDNLEWCSRRSNLHHALARELVPINLNNWVNGMEDAERERRMEERKAAPFSDDVVNRMREMRNSGISEDEIARGYGCLVHWVKKSIVGGYGNKLDGFTYSEYLKRERYLRLMERYWEEEMKVVRRDYYESARRWRVRNCRVELDFDVVLRMSEEVEIIYK